MKINKKESRNRRHKHVRKRIFGTADRPRVCVFRSSKHIYAQAIDDTKGITLVSACSLLKDLPSISEDELNDAKQTASYTIDGKTKIALAVGKLIGQRLKDQGIEAVVFDRGGYLYHGRVAALADGARIAGLQF